MSVYFRFHSVYSTHSGGRPYQSEQLAEALHTQCSESNPGSCMELRLVLIIRVCDIIFHCNFVCNTFDMNSRVLRFGADVRHIRLAGNG